MASLEPSGGGGGMVSVEAPCRMSIKGQSTSGCALATGCGCRCVAPEKKLAILSLKEGELAGEAGGGATGVAEVVAGDVAEVPPVAAGDGVPTPRLLLVQPNVAN